MSIRERSRIAPVGCCALLFIALAGCASTQSVEAYTPASGEASSSHHSRLSPRGARQGVSTPSDAERQAGTDISFLDPYDPRRIPVLFIHGINGSPRDFRYLIARLNRAHFQAWVFRYRSGAGLRDVTVQLRDAINGIESRYSVSSLIIVAHSMGGLIARDLLLSRAPEALPEVPLLITLSTPWEGHKGAAFGARFALTPPPSWRDMAPGSAYLSELFGDAPGAERTLPEGTQHHLFFSYRKSRVSFGESSDEVVSLASQLRGPAQEQASRLYGFDATHLGILSDAAAAAAMNRLLDATRVSSAVAALRR